MTLKERQSDLLTCLVLSNGQAHVYDSGQAQLALACHQHRPTLCSGSSADLGELRGDYESKT